MSSRGYSEDVITVLYMVPFVASGVYAIYLWARGGISAVLPTAVYLSVTRDPYIFIIGSLAVMAGVIMEVRSAGEADKQAKVKGVGETLQTIAIASLVLALICAWYANSFVHLSGTVTDFIVGRYSLIFPAMLVLLSYLVTVNIKVDSLKNPKVLGIIALLLVPAVVYEVGKRDAAGGFALALVLAIVGIGLLVRNGRMAKSPEKE